MTPLTYDALEFKNMPKSVCMTCGTSVPLQLLPFHIESCQLDDDSRILDMLQENSQAKRLMLFVCMEEGRSSTKSSSAVQGLLHEKETEPPLKFRMDIREDVEDQEERIISFYKVPKIDWARPLYCKLEGDVATGEGIKRHLFSLVMHKLRSGFITDFGNGTSTVIFEGQIDHLVPSTSQVHVQNDLFLMAVRMISHSFLHGGLLLAGLSPAIIHVLLYWFPTDRNYPA
ncbi:uncharacterized protein LOC108431952 [Pygocentrus nattereri]|uniref:uncharacterized protein LOC108431952 n=1 Tax=Pygocentrus nattereri TaxID=42514 RepID=UPI00081422DD|nr:uncharacterized protein LOC108431952 [Pygocentrus nattereri]XP_037399936.1 uncharacterized protein LOC108431952 [Pygocentrus nattereri]